MAFRRANLGHGIGLRPPHYTRVVEERPAIGWFEVITENFLGRGGNPRRILRKVRASYPVVLHGVGLSIGSCDPVDERYVDDVRGLAADVEPAWISDHLCWSSFGGHTAHDLWPIPLTEEALDLVTARVAYVQERLGRELLLENVSSYAQFKHSTISEEHFLVELAKRTGCGILLDVNNVYVNSKNHGFDAAAYVDAIPASAIGQVHLAGHADVGSHLLDTHDREVCDEVWSLYRRVVRRCGPLPTLIEWDDEIPSLERVLEESSRAVAAEATALVSVTRSAHTTEATDAG